MVGSQAECVAVNTRIQVIVDMDSCDRCWYTIITYSWESFISFLWLYVGWWHPCLGLSEGLWSYGLAQRCHCPPNRPWCALSGNINLGSNQLNHKVDAHSGTTFSTWLLCLCYVLTTWKIGFYAWFGFSRIDSYKRMSYNNRLILQLLSRIKIHKLWNVFKF